MIRIRKRSGETVLSGKFDIRRGVIQGDLFSPPCFTIGLDRIFRIYDTKCEGIGGPHMNSPTASKLEYADDAGLLNKTTADASIRTSSLATGSKEAATMEISLKKTKSMPIRRFEQVSETAEEEIIALKFKNKCSECDRTFPTEKGLKIHRARWCRPGGPARSRKGSLADKAVKLQKRKIQASELDPVIVNGHSLESVLRFEYLGCQLSGDGDDSADMCYRMSIAQQRFSDLTHIWNDRRLPIALKLRLYQSSICSTLTHGSEAWTLKPKSLRSLNGWNSRHLHVITRRSFREEAVMPSFDLVRAIRQRRHRWLGHVLRLPPTRLIHQAIVTHGSAGPPYPSGSLLMDCNNIPLHELIQLAANRSTWEQTVQSIDSLHESLNGALF